LCTKERPFKHFYIVYFAAAAANLISGWFLLSDEWVGRIQSLQQTESARLVSTRRLYDIAAN